MTDKQDNIEAAREHYKNRKEGRPVQTWNPELRRWEKNN